MNLKDFLEDCKQENIIDQPTLDRMYAHFLKRSEQSVSSRNQLTQNKQNNSLIITVSIIGVILIGFGVIYLFAHNWDHISRSNKTILSLTPVFLSILANVFTLTKRKDNVIWQESTAMSSFLAVGSMLALILQVYQLPGIENYFYTYWCFLCIPLVYLLRSHSAVFCVLILMLLNLTSNPMDQSELYRIPWFGSLMMFAALIPYFRKLFTSREPESLYVAHQIAMPIVVCLSAIASIHGTHSSIWLILFLLIANFHLFGTSRFLRKPDHTPNIMSILSYIGVSLSLSYLLFNENWGFENIMQVESHDYRLIFIPILFLVGIFQLFLYFSKEKPSIQNLYKWVMLLPLPFVFMNYSGINAFPAYEITLLVVGFVIVHFAQNRKDDWQLYSALGFVTLVLLSLSFAVANQYSFFLLALIPGMYYLVTIPLMEEKSKNTLEPDQIVILCFQFLALIFASFGGFWSLIKLGHQSMTSLQVFMMGLICLVIVLNVIKLRKQLFSHLDGILAIFSLLIPLLIWIGCISNFGIQHVFSIFLLAVGISALVLGAKKSNLTVANLALGLIGVVMACRFFDLKMTLTLKGILFILIGSSFFVANYIILKNRKHETNK